MPNRKTGFTPFEFEIMISPVFPCLWFDGKAKEAAELYCSVFKNSVITAETPLVVTFNLNSKKVMALNGGPMFTINPSISLFVTCNSVAETDRIWNVLVEGGSEYIPIGSYPWSKRYGWLKDRFGMTWQISFSENVDFDLRIIPSFLFTNAGLVRQERPGISTYLFSMMLQPMFLCFIPKAMRMQEK